MAAASIPFLVTPFPQRNGHIKPTRRRLGLLILGLDLVAAVVVFNVIATARGIGAPGDSLLLVELLPPFALMLFALYLIDGYSPRTDMVSLDYTSQHVLALALAMVGTLLLTFVIIPSHAAGSDTLRASRGVILSSFLVLAPLTLSHRRIIRIYYRRQHDLRSIVFVGTPASCEAFSADYSRSGMSQPLIMSVIEETSPTAPGGADSAASHLRDLLERIQRGELAVEAIVLRESGRELDSVASERLLALYFAGVPTYTLELFHDVYWRKIPLYRLNQTWLFQEGFQIAREPVFARIKRLSDLVFASVGLIASSPVMLAACIAIWTEDRGPVLFRQLRAGRNGKPFNVVKLRSMRSLPDVADPYTQQGDRRITKIGAFLRTTRIDELPQLWNVLRGDMSLIGPRAEWTRLVEEYEKKIPCYHYRHLVKPGITGWAQVNYPYGASTEDTLRKLEYDLYYIRHFSFLMDAAIVLKTIHVMMFGKGR